MLSIFNPEDLLEKVTQIKTFWNLWNFLTFTLLFAVPSYKTGQRGPKFPHILPTVGGGGYSVAQ